MSQARVVAPLPICARGAVAPPHASPSKREGRRGSADPLRKGTQNGRRPKAGGVWANLLSLTGPEPSPGPSRRDDGT